MMSGDLNDENKQEVKSTRRLHRKKIVEGNPEANLTKRAVVSPPLCTSCLRAMTLIERMKATVNAYKATCEAILDLMPADSDQKSQAEKRLQSANSTTQYAIGDAQYVIRNLACNKGCIPVSGKSVATHCPDHHREEGV